MSTITENSPKISTLNLEKFQHSDVESLMDYHELKEEDKHIIRTENLAPPALLSRLHNSFPQHSLFKRKATPIFNKGKNKYTGLSGFRMICDILKQHNIELSHIKERELLLKFMPFWLPNTS